MVRGLVGMVGVISWVMHYVNGSPHNDRNTRSCVCVGGGRGTGDRWAVDRHCGSLNTDEGQTEG